MIEIQLNPRFKTKIKQRTIDFLTQNGRAQSLDNFYQVPSNYSEFLQECCRIRSGNKFIPFAPFEYQKIVSDLIDKYRGIMIFKTRQLGLTECISAKFLHKALLNPAYAAAVLSLGQKESSNIAVRIQSMPANIKDLRFLTKSKTEIHFQNAGKIWFRPATDNATRSLESVSDIFYDEAAFPPNFSEIYASSTPSQEAVGENARTIMATTMSQLGKLSTFWQMFDSANPVNAEELIEKIKAGKEEPCYWWVDNNGWAKVIIHWKAHPVYSNVPDFLQKTKEKHKLTDDALNREYNLGIPDSGGALFSSENVFKCAVGSWALPNKERHYMAALDPNFGGTDYWEYLIIDITDYPYQVVAEYRENDRQSLFCIDKTLQLSDAYNPVLTVIEHNSGGAIIAAEIVKQRPGLAIDTVATTNTSKVVNTDRLALALEKREIIFPANWAGLTEFKSFSLQTRNAMYGHDDCIMCLSIAFARLETALRRRGGALAADLGTVSRAKSRFR